jgi:Tfp pilus assembly protein PilO
VIVKDERKTKKRLIAELDDLRQQLVETKESLAKLEALAAEQDRVERELGLYAESLESLV